MLIEVNDKKVRECLKSMYLDFKSSSIQNGEVQDFTNILRKVVNNNKINLLSGGLIFDYVSSQLENSIDYYLEKSLYTREDISFSEHTVIINEIYEEWEYLYEWFKKIFIIQNDYGLRTINLKVRK